MKDKKLTKKEKSVLNKAAFAATKRKKVAKEVVKVTREVESNLKRLTQKEILDLNAEEVIEMIRQAKSYVEIKERFGVNERFVSEFITSSKYSPAAREAQKLSAESIATKAENALLAIQADDTNASVTRQRELASHYRWLASKKNPGKFGESSTLKIDSESVVGPSVNVILNNERVKTLD